MNEQTLHDIRIHAAAAYEADKQEACGLVIEEGGREVYVACTNLAQRNPKTRQYESFILPADEFADAEDRGRILWVVHTHPDTTADPSIADRVACERSGLPWFVMGWPQGDTREMHPEGFEAPLVGRPFAHGVLDCYTLIRDWYRLERGVSLPDFDRRDGWWDDGQSDLYTQNFAAAGFADVDGSPCELHEAEKCLQPGDVIFMQIFSKNGVPNHAGVYVGDGQFLHHLAGRNSGRDVYGGYWRESTRRILRYVGR
ncbi:C40 family peptidase [Pandoraea sputorum]|uniref:C40 family peptidase n=1 Tax=Pandoraea sputorum TaxID=93222 RepID=UPI002F91AF3B